MSSEINLAEYSDTELYDLENQSFEPDGLFFLNYAQKMNGPVLELGCGTGRVTIPLAQNKIEITGLDLAPAMLETARQKAGDLPIPWILGDTRTFKLNQTFRLIFETGAVFQHLLERPDQEAYLARVREHLDPQGVFIMALIFPHFDRLSTVEEEQPWLTYTNQAGQEVRVSGTDFYDPLRQVKLETAYRRWTDQNGLEHCKVAPLSLRYLFPQEMETLLVYNGFQILERFGNWDFSPLSAASPLIIFVCQKSA
jgi:SAM-dependent methyltransferase